MWTQIAEHISQSQPKFEIKSHRPVSGGCINQGYAVSDGKRTYFVKLNEATKVEMFAAEALGLQEMVQTNTIHVPNPICWGIAANSAYIVLEWLSLGAATTNSWQKMGQNLAAMHRHTSSKGFGWGQNNRIGSTLQINNWTEEWADFYAQHRLGYQFQLAKRRGGHFPQAEQLLATIPQLLAHQVTPSLVHGDLWGGNAAFTEGGEPVVFDPAIYYGDREVDIAMTELFGGFPAAFYRAYNEAFPLESGYEQRKPLYNLYHILNHFNLFGGSYASQANQSISQILDNHPS
jgi:fructosamine-3-kinase